MTSQTAWSPATVMVSGGPFGPTPCNAVGSRSLPATAQVTPLESAAAKTAVAAMPAQVLMAWRP
ncbi:hypothetical protein [Caulobacter sp. 3R27C2-B]|uniref:hypothetical protein n=1 Tax=Caulobacter sp. 3R27C2-B TaxID=2502219 RepID=UPI0010F52177|nr:hypothetical protein [Caulobacter sp. 3R27C2-B]